MSVPKYNEMYQELLEVLSDGYSYKIGEIRAQIARRLNLSDTDLKEMIPSGKQPLFNNRINWTCTYLKQAHLIENVSRGIYRITELGKKVIEEAPPQIDNDFLLQFESFRNYISSDKIADSDYVNQAINVDRIQNQTPQDIFEDAYNKINNALAEDILTEIMKQSPVFFEYLVVKLLTKMGYGGSIKDSGTVTQRSGDEGIDGIIREDKLGFNMIYIQAKRWDRHTTVGRPEIQKFVGALAGQGAGKGLFITTAQFTKEAKEYASKQHTTKVVLVDGNTLAKLMIEYNVGVSVEATYDIKKIDSDFFDDTF